MTDNSSLNYFQTYLISEFAEDYQEGRIPRREALRLIGSVTGSLALASSILAACAPVESTPSPQATTSSSGLPPAPSQTSQSAGQVPYPEGANPTRAPAASTSEPYPAPSAGYGTVSPDDPAIQAASVEYLGTDGSAQQGYQAVPQGPGPFPLVLVCHENRGLTEHIQDVTRRLAKAGYLTLAVDLLSRKGGSAAIGPANAPGALTNIEPDQYVADFRSGYEYLKTLPGADASRLGMTGFCYGGGVTWLVSTRMPELKAAVPFYGPHPPLEDVPGIQAAVLGIYGGRDTRITSGVPEIEKAMQDNGKIFEKVIYPDADHAFFNDTGTRFDAAAASDAWSRLLAWFGKYV